MVNVGAPETIDCIHTVTSLQLPKSSSRPSVNEYLVLVADKGQDILGPWTFPGSSSSLSLDISSLPQCMSYLVFVTASNTGGSTTNNATLCELPPINDLTMLSCMYIHLYSPRSPHPLEVSCVAGEDGCYLEASCVPNQPGAGQWVQTGLHQQCWICIKKCHPIEHP